MQNEFCKRLKNPQGEVIGLWVADLYDLDLYSRVDTFHQSEGIPPDLYEDFLCGRYRTVLNDFDGKGGAFLMFGDADAPCEVARARARAEFAVAKLEFKDAVAPFGLAAAFLFIQWRGGMLAQTNWSFAFLGACMILMGRKGFTERGIPFTPNSYITGKPARIIGWAAILLGVACLFFNQIALAMMQWAYPNLSFPPEVFGSGFKR